MDHDHSEPATYSNELELTRRLIDANDRKHALHHCTGALALEPNRREWVPMLRELLADERLVASLEDNMFVGAQAARAYHLHGKGEYTEALAIIAATAYVDAGYLRWYESWLGDAIRASVPIQARAVFAVLNLGTKFGVGRIRMLPAEREAAMELVPIVRLAVSAVEDEPMIYVIASAILRRAGLHDEAIEVAERADGKVDSAMVATAVGLAQRSLGQFDKALATFERAYAETDDPLYLFERMRVLADAGRWKAALAQFDEVAALKELDPENLAERKAIALASLKGTAPAEPPLDVVRRRALNHGVLVPMLDASANVLRDVVRQLTEKAESPRAIGDTLRTAKLEAAVEGQEGPSARLCMAMMFAGSSDPRLASYQGSTLAIRTIDDEVDQYSLWKLEDGVIVQALPAPPAAVTEWVRNVALCGADETVLEIESDFLDMWAEAKRTPPPEAAARDWVAATIHPEMPIERVGMGPDWLLRWQVASLIGLAHSEAGWLGTAKRDALLALLRHEIDWPMAAAIRVALEIALEDPAATAEIRKQLIVLSSELIGDHNIGILHTLLIALHTLPFVSDEHKERVQKDLASRDEPAEDDEDEPEQAPEPEPVHEEPAPAPATKKPWWKFWN
ncbi:MAG: hypothetical protein HOV81_01305 [Kofleriaceae bacterium]|nr:hypothetical protein [Kofleriaceae bacterium]